MAVTEKVIESIKGIFSNDESNSKEPINDPLQQKMYDMVWQDYQVFKAARQPVEAKWREEQRFYMGDHWYGLRPDSVSKLRPNSVDNIAGSKIDAIYSKLTSWEPEPDFAPQEENDEQKAQELNEFMPYELRFINFHQKHMLAVFRFILHGPLVYKTIYDPTIEGGRGQNRFIGNNDIIPLDLGCFYPDPRIKNFIWLQKGKAHIIHTPRPLEYFVERWPKQGAKVQPDLIWNDTEVFTQHDYSQLGFNADLYNPTEYDQGANGQRSGLIEYWYKGTPKYMSDADKKLFKQLGDDALTQGKDPSIFYAKAKGKMDGIHCQYISSSGVFLEHKSYVYDHGQFPIVARTLFHDENSIWGKGYMRDMIKPQIMLNKFAEIAIETMAKAGNNAIVYEEGAITKPQTWKESRSLPGAMLPVANGRMNDWKEIQGVNVPNTVFNMLQYYETMLQKIPGMYDSAEGQANPNITSGEQAKALINASSTRLNVVSQKIEDALQEVFGQYIELMAQFYTEDRIVRVTGKNVSMNRDKLISQAQTTYQTQGENGQSVEQPVVEEYVPTFDIKVNIGVEKPTDREYWIQMAFNLLKMMDPITQLPMIDAEAVRYTVQNGRMEPMGVIKQRIQKEAQTQQKIQQMMMENQQLHEQLQQMGGQMQQMQQQDMSGQAEAMKQQNQAQQQEHQQQMDHIKAQQQQQKLDVDTLNSLSKANYAGVGGGQG